MNAAKTDKDADAVFPNNFLGLSRRIETSRRVDPAVVASISKARVEITGLIYGPSGGMRLIWVFGGPAILSSLVVAENIENRK